MNINPLDYYQTITFILIITFMFRKELNTSMYPTHPLGDTTVGLLTLMRGELKTH